MIIGSVDKTAETQEQVYFPLLFPLCYILPLAFMNLNMGKIKGKKIS